MAIWQPTDDQKRRAAYDTWNLYKGAGSGNWMGGKDDAYQIRGVQRAGDPNWVDFEYRSADGTGPTHYYGSLSSNTWDDPNADRSQEYNNFYNAAGSGMWDAWGQGYGWNNPAPQPPGGQNPNPVTPPNTGPTYTPPEDSAPKGGEEAMKYGFGVAEDLLRQMMQNPMTMPDWWGGDYQYFDAEKWSSMYPEWIQPTEYQTVANPGQYQGLAGGDYDRLEQSLRQPGETAAQTAYTQGMNNLKAIMGNSGMYGSSVMGKQANQGLNQGYMNTLADNAAKAASQRYGLQQGDLQFGANYGLQLADFARQQQMDKWKADTTNQGLLRDYNNQRFNFDFQNSQAGRQERNNLLQDRYQHQLQQVNWQNMINEQLMNRALALAGRGAPLTTAAMNYRANQDAINARDRNSMYNLLGSAAGSFFGLGSEGGWDDSYAKSIWDAFQ